MRSTLLTSTSTGRRVSGAAAVLAAGLGVSLAIAPDAMASGEGAVVSPKPVTAVVQLVDQTTTPARGVVDATRQEVAEVAEPVRHAIAPATSVAPPVDRVAGQPATPQQPAAGTESQAPAAQRRTAGPTPAEKAQAKARAKKLQAAKLHRKRVLRERRLAKRKTAPRASVVSSAQSLTTARASAPRRGLAKTSHAPRRGGSLSERRQSVGGAMTAPAASASGTTAAGGSAAPAAVANGLLGSYSTPVAAGAVTTLREAAMAYRNVLLFSSIERPD
jgi:hypothetical protein